MHPDDPERNYVSHCHTENRLWRPEAVVIHHRDSSLNVASAASKPQLQQMPHNRVSHDSIFKLFLLFIFVIAKKKPKEFRFDLT